MARCRGGGCLVVNITLVAMSKRVPLVMRLLARLDCFWASSRALMYSDMLSVLRWKVFILCWRVRLLLAWRPP